MGILCSGFSRKKVGLEYFFFFLDIFDSLILCSSAFVLPGGKVFVFTGILPIVQNEGTKLFFPNAVTINVDLFL